MMRGGKTRAKEKGLAWSTKPVNLEFAFSSRRSAFVLSFFFLFFPYRPIPSFSPLPEPPPVVTPIPRAVER